MIARSFAIVILFNFGLSLFLFPLLEAGHEVLHHFENEIHHHEAGPHHTLADHHLEPHHHDADDDDDDMDDDVDGNSLLSLLFGFFNQCKKDETTIPSSSNLKNTELICAYNSINLSPPTPPPLSVG